MSRRTPLAAVLGPLAAAALAAALALSGCGGGEARSTATTGARAKTAAGTPARSAAKTDASGGARAGGHAQGATNGRSAAAAKTGSHPSAQAGASSPATHGHGSSTRARRSSLPPATPAKPGGHGGGLSVSPGVFERIARRGRVGSIEISNTTATPMKVTVALRPWLQARSGQVSPNRHATVPGVRLAASSFTLAPARTQALALSLTRIPPGGSLYGAIEVTGAPPRARGKRSGVTLAYRIVNSLRLVPARGARVFRASAGRLIEQGTFRHGTLSLAVRNTGNTIVPIGATVHVRGRGLSLGGGMRGKAIAPGHTVDLPLTQLTGSLPRGRYRVVVTLTQAGHKLGTVNRTIDLR
jgi:hypothetical protein